MKNLNRTILIFTFLSVFSCTTNYYVPNTQNVPLIKETGEINLTLAGSQSQGELQVAYGLTDTLALMSDVLVVFPQNTDTGNGGSGALVNLGLGYYKSLSKEFLFDTYGILGFGQLENHFPGTIENFPNTSGKISANLMRFAIQPSVSFDTEYYSITGSTRFAALSYINISGSLNVDNKDQVNFLENNRLNFLIEPAITFRAGIEKIKGQIQYLHSFNLSNLDFTQSKDIITFGCNLQF